ncbi:hypothetical protein L873DRAFT_430968 [Choiromyces venosus 120613-1]|uniref:Uncharacterized protein n=1 Tax=Choiromyces venosus 120613-1 TaxID=1336337 RepID=A0A3N4J1V7_9PEZI|nr:hypothetical protein L873DRAFT_430968 [Choiromyces venosus 120613-1]
MCPEPYLALYCHFTPTISYVIVNEEVSALNHKISHSVTALVHPSTWLKEVQNVKCSRTSMGDFRGLKEYKRLAVSLTFDVLQSVCYWSVYYLSKLSHLLLLKLSEGFVQIPHPQAWCVRVGNPHPHLVCHQHFHSHYLLSYERVTAEGGQINGGGDDVCYPSHDYPKDCGRAIVRAWRHNSSAVWHFTPKTSNFASRNLYLITLIKKY